MRMLIDSHVNLHGEAYATDLPAVLARGRAAGIGGFLCICDKWRNFEAVRAIAASAPDLWASVGAHPHYASEHRDLSAARIAAAAADPVVIGVGETGLDQYYGHSPLEDQIAVFAAHIEAAQITGLPIIIHTRNADELTADMLEAAYAVRPFGLLLHCYTGGMALAARAMALGGYVSFSGIATFKNAHDVREVARQIPLERLLIETDCPYLAPMPFRGRRCEPAYLTATAAFLADFLRISPDTLAEATTANFFRLFAKAQAPIAAARS